MDSVSTGSIYWHQIMTCDDKITPAVTTDSKSIVIWCLRMMGSHNIVILIPISVIVQAFGFYHQRGTR